MNKRTIYIAAVFAVLGFALTMTLNGKEEVGEFSSGTKPPKMGKTSAGPVKGKIWTVPELGMNFVYVKSGKFKMGSNNVVAFKNEQPVHTVRITKGFWIGEYEVTQAEYEELLEKTPSRFKGGQFPVEQVSWNDAMEFCNKLTEQERNKGRLPSDYVYRLPTEAEWEYAARGGNKSRGFKYSGSNNVDEVAWHKGNREDRRTHEVGRLKSNELGLHDMSGNVSEWCYDWYDMDYYDRSPDIDPVNTNAASFRVTRGGSWIMPSWGVRSADRVALRPDYKCEYLGFRVVLAPEIEQ